VLARRVLVTGGSGFIGTHLVSAVLDDGADLLNLDVKRPVLPDQRKHWRDLDLLDAKGVEQAVVERRPDVIFNLAAVADIWLTGDALLANTQGLRNLIVASSALPSSPRLLHVSTQLVVKAGYTPQGVRDYAPYTEYGRSKAASEEILWKEAGDLVWTVLRPTNVWGPRHPTFPGSTWKYLARRWYPLPSGFDPVRSYGYVTNVVGQMMAASKAEPAAVNQRIFYVGDEPIASSKWLDGFSFALTGRKARRVPGNVLKLLALGGEVMHRIGGPAPLDRGRLYRMTTDYQVPMEETFETLGRGSVSRDQGIEETVAWLQKALPDEYQQK